MNISITTSTTIVDYAIVNFEHGYYNFGAAYTQCGYHNHITLYDVSALHSAIRVLIEKAKMFHSKSTTVIKMEGNKCRVIEKSCVDAYSKKMSEFSAQFNRLVADITVQYDGQIEATKTKLGHEWDAVSKKFVPSKCEFANSFFFKVSIG